MSRKLAVLATCLALSVFAATPSSAWVRAPRTAPAPVVLIMMENHGFKTIIGSAQAPYLNGTFVPSGTVFTRYSALFHPSLPNYLAITSGTTSGCLTDACPTGRFRTNNIFAQLHAAHLGWTSWAESMPTNCASTNSGTYAVRHNPAVYFRDLRPGPCARHDVPYPKTLPVGLAPFTFVTPNLCHDMHDCSVAAGDRWLARHVPPLLAKGAIVVITFDEGGLLNHVVTAVSGPGVPAGVRDHAQFDHYGLLAGIEDHFGLARLHHAAKAMPLPI